MRITPRPSAGATPYGSKPVTRPASVAGCATRCNATATWLGASTISLRTRTAPMAISDECGFF
jgi:hypothetical protein